MKRHPVGAAIGGDQGRIGVGARGGRIGAAGGQVRVTVVGVVEGWVRVTVKSGLPPSVMDGLETAPTAGRSSSGPAEPSSTMLELTEPGRWRWSPRSGRRG
ncbi:MAG: hypothetical protein IPL70_12250 [Uliginosibacterium sp.]|nr:hypothetical protein [Uliginosibacterium sp.]